MTSIRRGSSWVSAAMWRLMPDIFSRVVAFTLGGVSVLQHLVNRYLKSSSKQDVRLGFGRHQPVALIPDPTHGFPACRGASCAQSTNRPCSTSENPWVTSSTECLPWAGSGARTQPQTHSPPPFYRLADAFQEGFDRFKLCVDDVNRVDSFSHLTIFDVIAETVNRFLVQSLREIKVLDGNQRFPRTQPINQPPFVYKVDKVVLTIYLAFGCSNLRKHLWQALGI